MDDWFLKQDAVDSGPYMWGELRFLARRGKLKSHELVRRGASGDWVAATQVPGLYTSAEARGREEPAAATRRTQEPPSPPARGSSAGPNLATTVASMPPSPPRPVAPRLPKDTVRRAGRRRRIAFAVTAGVFSTCLLVFALLALFGGRARPTAGVADGAGIAPGSGTGIGADEERDVGPTAGAGLGVRGTNAANDAPDGDEGPIASRPPVIVPPSVPGAAAAAPLSSVPVPAPVAPDGVTSTDPPAPVPAGPLPAEKPTADAAATSATRDDTEPQPQPPAVDPTTAPEPPPHIKSFLAQRKATLAMIREQKTARILDETRGGAIEIRKKIAEGNAIIARAHEQLEREQSEKKGQRSKPQMKALRKTISDVEAQVKKLGKRLADLEKRPDELLKEGMERIEREMAELDEKVNPGLGLNTNNLAVGMVGVILGPSAVQWGAGRGLGAPAARNSARGQSSSYNVKVFQVIDDRNFLAETMFGNVRGRAALIWIKGVSAKGMTDGSFQAIEDLLFVSGTKLYGTAVGGTKTVFVLEPFDVEEAKKYLPARSEQSGPTSADAVPE